METAFMITVAALAILGFYFLLKIISSLIFASKSIAAAVIIDDKKQLRNLDLLFDDASSALFATRRRRIALFVPYAVWSACDEGDKKLAEDLIDRFGAEFYII